MSGEQDALFLILLCSGGLATRPDTEEIKALRLLKHVPWSAPGDRASVSLAQAEPEDHTLPWPFTNAVCLQVAAALLALLLLRLVHAAQQTINSPPAFRRLVKSSLMHEKRIDRFLEPELGPTQNPGQLSLKWV